MTSIRSAACPLTSSRLARMKELKRLLFWQLLHCVFGAREWGARGAGAPPGGRGASIFLGGAYILLGGGDPFQPEIFV
jgi:hypothetical protein